MRCRETGKRVGGGGGKKLTASPGVLSKVDEKNENPFRNEPSKVARAIPSTESTEYQKFIKSIADRGIMPLSGGGQKGFSRYLDLRSWQRAARISRKRGRKKKADNAGPIAPEAF